MCAKVEKASTEIRKIREALEKIMGICDTVVEEGSSVLWRYSIEQIVGAALSGEKENNEKYF